MQQLHNDDLLHIRDFAGYVVNSKEELVTGLKTLFSYTLLPAESFFHTVMMVMRIILFKDNEGTDNDLLWHYFSELCQILFS